MARGVVFLLLIVAIVTIINAAPPNCGPNEVFNTCGSTCVATCQKPKTGVCTLACKIGCECQEGFVRNANNECVLTQNC